MEQPLEPPDELDALDRQLTRVADSVRPTIDVGPLRRRVDKVDRLSRVRVCAGLLCLLGWLALGPFFGWSTVRLLLTVGIFEVHHGLLQLWSLRDLRLLKGNPGDAIFTLHTQPVFGLVIYGGLMLSAAVSGSISAYSLCVDPFDLTFVVGVLVNGGVFALAFWLFRHGQFASDPEWKR